jgi:hypothetical protein
MKFDALHELFMARNPKGIIAHNGDRTYQVCFSSPGKLYTYRSGSHYALAERLDLIPEYDVVSEAERIVAALRNGADSIIAYSAASDTARMLWAQTGLDGWPDTRNPTLDRFDRPMLEYYIETDSGGWF